MLQGAVMVGLNILLQFRTFVIEIYLNWHLFIKIFCNLNNQELISWKCLSFFLWPLTSQTISAFLLFVISNNGKSISIEYRWSNISDFKKKEKKKKNIRHYKGAVVLKDPRGLHTGTQHAAWGGQGSLDHPISTPPMFNSKLRSCPYITLLLMKIKLIYWSFGLMVNQNISSLSTEKLFSGILLRCK